MAWFQLCLLLSILLPNVTSKCGLNGLLFYVHTGWPCLLEERRKEGGACEQALAVGAVFLFLFSMVTVLGFVATWNRTCSALILFIMGLAWKIRPTVALSDEIP